MSLNQGIGDGTFTLPPGLTIPPLLTPWSNKSRASSSLNEFLNSQARKCHNVIGDDNCMFHATSHQLFGSDQQHSQLRLTLQEIIEKRQSLQTPLDRKRYIFYSCEPNKACRSLGYTSRAASNKQSGWCSSVRCTPQHQGDLLLESFKTLNDEY